MMEYADGGTLESRLVSMPGQRFTEDAARDIFRQIASAVRYCHRKQVAHRDLKTENVLLTAGSHVKVADFGLSNTMSHASHSPVGTPLYSAPEILFPGMYPFLHGSSSGSAAAAAAAAAAATSGAAAPAAAGRSAPGSARGGVLSAARGGVPSVPSLPKGALTDVRPPQHVEYTGLMADIWSLGVVLFRLVTGRLPFPAESMRQLKTLLFDGSGEEAALVLPFPTGPDKLSPSLESLITGCLRLNPFERLSADEALQHRWLSADASDSLTSFLLGGGGSGLDSGDEEDDEEEDAGKGHAAYAGGRLGSGAGARPRLSVEADANSAGGGGGGDSTLSSARDGSGPVSLSVFSGAAVASARGSGGRRFSAGGDAPVDFSAAAAAAGGGVGVSPGDDDEDGPVSLIVGRPGTAGGSGSLRGPSPVPAPDHAVTAAAPVTVRPSSSSTTLRRPIASAGPSSSASAAYSGRYGDAPGAAVSRRVSMTAAPVSRLSSTTAEADAAPPPPSYRFSTGSRQPVASFTSTASGGSASRPGSGRVVPSSTGDSGGSSPPSSVSEGNLSRSPVKSAVPLSPLMLGRPGGGVRLSLTGGLVTTPASSSTQQQSGGGGASLSPYTGLMGTPTSPAAAASSGGGVGASPPGSSRPPASPAHSGRTASGSGTSELLQAASVAAARRRTETGGAASPLSLAAAAAVAGAGLSPVSAGSSPRFPVASGGASPPGPAPASSRPSSGAGFATAAAAARGSVPSRLSLQSQGGSGSSLGRR